MDRAQIRSAPLWVTEEIGGAIAQSPGPGAAARDCLEGEGRVRADRVKGCLRPRVLRAPPFAVHEEQATRREVLDATVEDKLTRIRPPGRLRSVDSRDEFRPMTTSVIAQQRHLDGH